MTYSVDWLMDNPYWSFEEAIQTPVDEFPIAWKEFWGIGAKECPEHLDPDDWEIANEMHDTARRICHAVGDLQGRRLPDPLRTLPGVLEVEARSERRSRSELADQIESQVNSEELQLQVFGDLIRFLRWEQGAAEAKDSIFQTAFQIYSYPQFGCGPGTVAARLLELLEFLVRTEGERTREYLRRVATCYVREMPAEMAVMSRSVVESALESDEAIERRVEENLQVQEKHHPGLGDWVQAAFEVGALDSPGRRSATAVKEAGDNAVHNLPQLVPSPRSILEDLRVVLQQLEGFRNRKGRGSGE